MMAAMRPSEVREMLDRELPGWQFREHLIEKEYHLKSFRDAVRLFNAIADLAEALNHHPRIINVYKRLKVELWTHTAGGVTEKDFQLARQIEQAAQALGVLP
jgi:4a-hydroxytetrahydrobiopterin dehydratase